MLVGGEAQPTVATSEPVAHIGHRIERYLAVSFGVNVLGSSRSSALGANTEGKYAKSS